MNEIKSITKARRLRAIAEHDRIRRQRENARGWPLPPETNSVDLGSRQHDFWASVDRVADAAHQQRCAQVSIRRVLTDRWLSKEGRAVDLDQVEHCNYYKPPYSQELTEEQAERVCQLRCEGMTIEAIADAVGVPVTRAYRLLCDRNMNLRGFGRKGQH